MTVSDILRTNRTLIRERAALIMLGIANREPARQWLSHRLNFELAMLPRQVRLYRVCDVRKLRLELDQIAHLQRPHP